MKSYISLDQVREVLERHELLWSDFVRAYSGLDLNSVPCIPSHVSVSSLNIWIDLKKSEE